MSERDMSEGKALEAEALEDMTERLYPDLGFKSHGRGWWQPMLAKVYNDDAPPRVPLYAQPKLDGTRALWDGKEFWSRSGKKTLVPSAGLMQVMDGLFRGLPLDGEFYDHDLPFEEIVSRARTGGRLKYCVYDMPTSESFGDRWEHLKEIFKSVEVADVELVDTMLVTEQRSLDVHLSHCLNFHYEGQILREPNEPYRFGRSSALVKRKPWREDEAVVVGVTEGKGKHEGAIGALRVATPAWSCKVGSGLSDAQRHLGEGWWIGKVVEVEYQELSRYGVPRFPRLRRVKP